MKIKRSKASIAKNNQLDDLVLFKHDEIMDNYLYEVSCFKLYPIGWCHILFSSKWGEGGMHSAHKSHRSLQFDICFVSEKKVNNVLMSRVPGGLMVRAVDF